MKNESFTRNYYDGIAKGYFELYSEEQKLKIFKVLDYLPKSGLILDLGCGNGVLNEFLIGCDLVSLDLSFELLKLNGNERKICGSVMSLPFFDKVFDFVLSFTMLQDVPDSIKALDEIKRVLKDNGVLILSFLKLSSVGDKILKKIKSDFEIVFEYEEVKDYIFVLKNK